MKPPSATFLRMVWDLVHWRHVRELLHCTAPLRDWVCVSGCAGIPDAAPAVLARCLHSPFPLSPFTKSGTSGLSYRCRRWVADEDSCEKVIHNFV